MSSRASGRRKVRLSGLGFGGGAAERAGALRRFVDVGERQHRSESVGGRLVEARGAVEPRRIAEAAEQQVPERQIAVIIGVDVALVMNAMGFRPLDQVSEPL